LKLKNIKTIIKQKHLLNKEDVFVGWPRGIAPLLRTPQVPVLTVTPRPPCVI